MIARKNGFCKNGHGNAIPLDKTACSLYDVSAKKHGFPGRAGNRGGIMLLTTSENIAGVQFLPLGVVTGNVVQAKHIGRDLMAGFKSIVGGEIKGYTELLNESRSIATGRLVEEAKKLGADAVVCLRYNSAAVMDGACEVMAYGTAVKFG